MKYKGLFVLTGCIALLQSPNTYAGSFTEWLCSHEYHSILTLTSGPAFYPDPSESHSIPSHGGVLSFFNYSHSDGTHTQPVYGASIAIETFLTSPWSLQTGLSYYRIPDILASGTVNQGIDAPSSNTYSYQYNIASNQILIESKLLYDMERYHPYGIVGIGTSLNYAKNYNVNIQPPFTTFSNQFKDHMNADFSYNIGFGVDIDLAKNSRLGIGYRFAGFGKAETGKGIIDTVHTNDKLSSAYIYANELIVQLSFDIV